MFWSRWHAGQPDLSIVHRLKVANGELEKPKVWDPVLETLAERGALHEQGFIEHIKAEGLSVTVIDGGGVDPKSVAATREAMARGEAFIVQGALQAGKWKGRADVLRRVETPSRFGPWSYEVIDTKLARETKGNTVLQISLYSDLLSETQEAEPTSAFVVTPGTNFVPETYRVADYGAYYRHVRSSLESSVSGAIAGDPYPEPIEHCEICRWRRHCDERRRADDHMSLVAGISKSHACFVFSRKIGRSAFWEFCNTISGKPDRVRLDAPVGGSGWPNKLNGSAMTARNIAKALWLQRQAPARGRGQATMSYGETPRVGVDPKQ